MGLNRGPDIARNKYLTREAVSAERVRFSRGGDMMAPPAVGCKRVTPQPGGAFVTERSTRLTDVEDVNTSATSGSSTTAIVCSRSREANRWGRLSR